MLTLLVITAICILCRLACLYKPRQVMKPEARGSYPYSGSHVRSFSESDETFN